MKPQVLPLLVMKSLKTIFFLTTISLTLLISNSLPDELQAAERVLSTTAKQKEYLGIKRPGFTLIDIKGQQRSVDEWDGKVLIINFWASWCSPCRKEIPVFNRLQQEYGPDGVQFVGIAIDNKKAVRQFIQSTPMLYPVIIGEIGAVKLSLEYGNITGTLPYTVFIDRQGKIMSIAGGGLTEKYARQAIEKLL